MGIPALVGTGEIDESCDGEIGLLDSKTGTLLIDPSGEQIVEFERKKLEENKIKAEHEKYLRSLINKPAVSKGGHRVLIYANIGGEYELRSALENGAEGIGLLRSEFLYLSLDRLPTEEELFEAYRSIVTKMEGRRVIIRTLDIGADKQIPYFNLPKEENPALGFRGVRVCLDRRDVFKDQIKAILRASAYGRAAIMIPMIVSVDEVRECKRLIEECKHQLFDENREFDTRLEMGIMIETPASAIMCNELAREVDFFSVGTNDLTQYTLAADRQNPRVAPLCENNYEPVLRLIEGCADAIHKSGGWIGVCGELSANLLLTERFVNMKIDELSMSPSYLLGIRKRVGECK
jgi:phosphotransferase system enzyme I (PtsI)